MNLLGNMSMSFVCDRSIFMPSGNSESGNSGPKKNSMPILTGTENL